VSTQRRLSALNALHERGVLTYRGVVGSGPERGYEVAVGDWSAVLPAARVEAVCRAATLLADAGLTVCGVHPQQVSVRWRGAEDGEWAVPVEAAPDWVAGWTAAEQSAGKVAGGSDGSAAVRAVLQDPTASDQMRLELHAAMEADGVSIAELARRVGHTDKTVSQLLRFDRWLGLRAAEELVRALGRRWNVTASAHTGPVQPASRAATRALRLIAATDAGWLTWESPREVSRALSPARVGTVRRYRVRVAGAGVELDERGVDAWLDGMAAWHATQSEVTG
jgi:hypothetical protein